MESLVSGGRLVFHKGDQRCPTTRLSSIHDGAVQGVPVRGVPEDPEVKEFYDDPQVQKNVFPPVMSSPEEDLIKQMAKGRLSGPKGKSSSYHSQPESGYKPVST